MDVCRSAYYGWIKGRGQSPENKQKQKQLEMAIVETFKEHRRRYGVRRIAAELRALGYDVGRDKVRSVMQAHGLRAIQPRSFVPRTTDSRHPYPISPNLLLERAAPVRPDEVWVGDITYIPMSGGGFCYLAVWMDLYSRRIKGWHLDTHMKEDLVVTALKNSFSKGRVPKGLIIHSDRGGQYAGKVFRKLLESKCAAQSMSRADNPYDNAFMESLYSRFKAELMQGGAFENLEDARTEIFEYVEMYYNTVRRHSSLGYLSPDKFEKQYYCRSNSKGREATKTPVRFK